MSAQTEIRVMQLEARAAAMEASIAALTTALESARAALSQEIADVRDYRGRGRPAGTTREEIAARKAADEAALARLEATKAPN